MCDGPSINIWYTLLHLEAKSQEVGDGIMVTGGIFDFYAIFS